MIPASTPAPSGGVGSEPRSEAPKKAFRAVFFGTPQFAVPCLDALAEIAEVVAVVCQPDRPQGRGLELSAPPVQKRALELGLGGEQPTKLRTGDFREWLS